jgi:hypothetical protein
MNTSELNIVPLQLASLCLDCEMITSGRANCFACGSAALLDIARALDGDKHGSRVPRKRAAGHKYVWSARAGSCRYDSVLQMVKQLKSSRNGTGTDGCP